MYDEILVPTDGSDTIPKTVPHALRIGNHENATIHGLYVVDSRITAAAPVDSREDILQRLEAEGTNAVEYVASEAKASGLESVTAVRQGTPSKEIIEYATNEEIDLIVIGTAGKSPREKVTSLGSVSERVVDDATLPVMVVRSGD